MWILRHTLIKSHFIWIPHILKIQLVAVQSHICTVECNIISDIDIVNSRNGLACRDSRFSSIVSRGETSATQRQKFHTDDVNQCLHNISGSDGVPHPNLFNFTFPLVDFIKVLCSSANELQQNSDASSREEYISPILTVLLEIHRVYI